MALFRISFDALVVSVSVRRCRCGLMFPGGLICVVILTFVNMVSRAAIVIPSYFAFRRRWNRHRNEEMKHRRGRLSSLNIHYFVVVNS